MNAQPATAPVTDPLRFPTPEILREVPEPELEPEFNPLQALFRLLRGRWLTLLLTCLLGAGGAGFAGFSLGTAIFEGRAIIRISAREPSILFASADDSRLKLFQAFVKGETTYVASHPVMTRAAEILSAGPDGVVVTAKDVSDAVKIDRKDALILISAVSTDASRSAATANAVVDAYLALTAENELDRANYREKELAEREAVQLAKLQKINAEMLEVGGEFGSASLAKAHITKVAQLEAMMARRAEVESTLEAMHTQTDLASADMGDVEIKRATLLDRGLADLTFDKAKREAELVSLRRRYVEGNVKIAQKQRQIIIIDAAIKARREQIAVLGRTGALTDAETSTEEETTADIEALLAKVIGQIEESRADARALNGKRLKLEFLQEERDEVRRMLDETRRALDAVRLERQNAMPGLIEVLTPAVTPDGPAKDKRKLFGAAGVAGGGLLALVMFMAFFGTRGTLRFSDDLLALSARAPMLRVIPRRQHTSLARRDVDHLCNAIQLLPEHGGHAPTNARVIAIGGADSRHCAQLARDLGESFARRAIPTLLIDADLVTGALTEEMGLQGQPGWRDMLMGTMCLETGGDTLLCSAGVGIAPGITDESVSAQSVRNALHTADPQVGAIIVHVGAFPDRLSAHLIAAASDLVIGVARPGDRWATADTSLSRAHELSRNGAALVFLDAERNDPGIVY